MWGGPAFESHAFGPEHAQLAAEREIGFVQGSDHRKVRTPWDRGIAHWCMPSHASDHRAGNIATFVRLAIPYGIGVIFFHSGHRRTRQVTVAAHNDQVWLVIATTDRLGVWPYGEIFAGTR